VDLSNPLDSAGLIGEVLKNIGIMVFIDDPKAEFNVHKMCDAMGDTSNGLSHMDKLAEQMKKLLKVNNEQCLEFRFGELEKKLEADSWDTYLSGGPNDRVLLFYRCKYSMTLRIPAGIGLPEERIQSYKNYTLESCRRAFK